MRTVRLRERSRHLVRLDPLDLACLQGQPASWFRIERVAGSRRHLVTVGGIAGCLMAPTCRLVIAPKLPLGDLHFLLDLDAPPTVEPLGQGADVSARLLDFLAAGFLQHLRERLRAGLHRGYREESLADSVLRGRLDVAAQIRQGPTRPDVLHQTVDQFTVDMPCNRLLRAALDELGQQPGLALPLRAEVRDLQGRLAEVQPLERDAWRTSLVSPPEYAAVSDLARLVLGGLPAGQGGGPGVAFVLELERLFERYVLRALQRAAGPGVVVEPQARRVLRGDGPALVIQPDALVLTRGIPTQVLDAKWKRLVRGRPSRSDLYQILAYASALGIPRAALVYPGRVLRSRSYPVTRSGTTVTLWTLPTNCPASAVYAMIRAE